MLNSSLSPNYSNFPFFSTGNLIDFYIVFSPDSYLDLTQGTIDVSFYKNGIVISSFQLSLQELLPNTAYSPQGFSGQPLVPTDTIYMKIVGNNLTNNFQISEVACIIEKTA